MPRVSSNGSSPDWDKLFDFAVGQAGYVTTAQAAQAGYSPPLLQFYVDKRRLERVQRGILRVVHFSVSEHEDLVPEWLWTDREGIFSHETALMLHDLSDALPSKRHITAPASWEKRRLRVPKGIILHFADVPKADATWFGPVPITTALRTVVDCAKADTVDDFVRQAVRQGIRRGLFERAEVNSALRQVRKFQNGTTKLPKP